jgi:drug/metabolite transporter (DMT)-like permease
VAELGWGLLVDGPLLLLTIWLLRSMRPVGFSARFALVPLVTILGGAAVMRPQIGWAGWIGLGVATVAGVVLVRDSVQGEADNTVG